MTKKEGGGVHFAFQPYPYTKITNTQKEYDSMIIIIIIMIETIVETESYLMLSKITQKVNICYGKITMIQTQISLWYNYPLVILSIFQEPYPQNCW